MRVLLQVLAVAVKVVTRAGVLPECDMDVQARLVGIGVMMSSL
jgi:hypothetical protein